MLVLSLFNILGYCGAKLFSCNDYWKESQESHRKGRRYRESFTGFIHRPASPYVNKNIKKQIWFFLWNYDHRYFFFDCKVFIVIATNDLSKFLQKFNQSFQGFKIYWFIFKVQRRLSKNGLFLLYTHLRLLIIFSVVFNLLSVCI